MWENPQFLAGSNHDSSLASMVKADYRLDECRRSAVGLLLDYVMTQELRQVSRYLPGASG